MATKYTIEEIAKMTPEAALMAKWDEYDDATASETSAINERYNEGAKLREAQKAAQIEDDEPTIEELIEASEKVNAAIRAAHPNDEITLSVEDEIVVGLIEEDGEVSLVEDLFTVTDIVRKLGYPKRHEATGRAYVKAEIKAKRLPAKKIGSQWIIKRADYLEWLISPRRGSRRFPATK